MVTTTLLLLHLLLYMDFGGVEAWHYRTIHCFAMKTESALRPCNRVCNTEGLCGEEVESIKNYFGATPFTWFIQVDDTASSAILKEQGLQCVAAFPAMKADIYTLSFTDYGADIQVIPVRTTSDLNTWISIISGIYNYPPEQLKKAISYLMDRGKQAVTLYLGFYHNSACAASMSIQHNTYVTLHMVGTLSEYRKKGLGYAVTHKPLLDAAQQGCTYALLFGSKMGESLYTRLGFKEYMQYHIYALA